MKQTLALMPALVLTLLAVGLAVNPQGNDLQAVYNLSGVLESLENKELVVTFSDDMLPLGGKRDGASLVTITPATAGEFTWRGNRSLAFRPAGRFRYSTTYTAVIPAGTRSLSGKVLAREIRWRWSTPQAIPREVKAASRGYFSDLAQGEELDFEVWVKEPLLLRFNQPVSAAAASEYLVLKEAKSGASAQVRLVQKASDTIEIQFPRGLQRGILHQIILKKGFCGSEGSTGTAKDFSFTFNTVPPFAYFGQSLPVLFPDAPYCWLPFSNPLAEYDSSLIQVFRVSGKEKKALKFRLEPRYHENESLFLNIEDELASGDMLRIRVDGRLANIYREHLPQTLEIDARVCSSRSPGIHFSLQDKILSASVKSMKQFSVRLLKLKPDFYTQLADSGFGILQRKGFREQFVEKELLQKLADLPEKQSSPALKDNELGSPLGFFGFLVQRYEPYNACRDTYLLRLPASMPQRLEVFHRRNMDMVVKAGRGQTLYWLYDNRSGMGLANKPVLLSPQGNEAVSLGESSPQGILVSPREISPSDLVLARNPADSDMALARIGQGPASDREVRITLFSDRDFYRPGDTVYIGGIVKEYASGKLSSPREASAFIEIIGPDWQRVKVDALRLDPLGGFQYEYKSDPAGKKGNYQVLARVQDTQNWQSHHNITIDFYQPNTFDVAISGTAERYLFTDVFRPAISGSYLAGNPMANDRFTYALGLSPAVSRPFSTGGLERYDFGLDPDLAHTDPPREGGHAFDASGKFSLNIPMSVFKETNCLAAMDFSATGKSAEGKEFTRWANALYFPGNLLTGIRIGYYQSLKEKTSAELALVDSQGKPASGEIKVSLYREYYENHQRRLRKIAGPDDVFIDRTATQALRIPEAGHYVLRCDTPDQAGRVVSTSASFFAWDSGYSDREDGLRIESEQDVLRPGGMLKCFIRAPRAGQALVTVERGKVLDSRVIALQKMSPLEIPVKKEYFPGFRLSVVAMYENNVSEEASRDFQVADESRSLRIELEAPGEIKPASKSAVKIRVSDGRKAGAKAKVFVWAVDEGNLSLQGYQTPDAFRQFYYTNPLGRGAVRTYFSKHFTHWTFTRPLMDIELPGPSLFGCVLRPDSTPIAGATVTIEDEKHRMLKTAKASAQGYYFFTSLPAGRYSVKAEAAGYHPFLSPEVYFNAANHVPCDLALIPVGGDKYMDGTSLGGVSGGAEGFAVSGVAPAPMAAERKMMAQSLKEEVAISGEADLSGIRVRSDFREVLFFKLVETDEAGSATVDFTSSDQLSTFRIMAVAYDEERFGRAERKLVVSKDLLIAEAMPEFARQGDEFRAGVQLSNRTAQDLAVTLLAKPEGLAVVGPSQLQRRLGPRKNDLFQFPFLADRIGEAKVVFYALSAADKDGLEKKLPVTDRLVMETLLDFASGREVRKAFAPQPDGEEQAVSIKAAASLLRPAVHIAKKLVFYPYECLEQRTSKVMPFLALSPALAERLDLGLDQGQIRGEIEGYLKIIPEFMSGDGALSYYRGGQYASDYLTAYVLWALYLARERDYKVDPQLIQKLTSYLRRANLDKTCQSFFQFVLSLHKEADKKQLKKLADERASLPLTARVFLYRALHHQGIAADTLKAMLDEFNNSLEVEADFAYFDAGEFKYHRDFPFYSSRFATALLLQAVLEVERGHVLAERIINWLLEGEPYCWNTTQTNFWILSAMDEYLKQVEKTTARRAEIVLLGEKTAKEFAGYRDTLQVARKLEGRKEGFEAVIRADQPVYVTSELTWKLRRAGKKSRGIEIRRNIYNERGETVDSFRRGQVYQVELLIRADKEVPYGVIDEPLAAGFELLRQDIATTRSLKEFNTANYPRYRSPWLRQENAADRLVFYTYSMNGDMRIVYFIKAMYSGRFTWMPAVAQGMYHPQYFGRTDMRTVEVRE